MKLVKQKPFKIKFNIEWIKPYPEDKIVIWNNHINNIEANEKKVYFEKSKR